MSKKKTIAVAIVLALILLIGGMLAYFTDTDVAVNKFTLGDEIDIEISEGNGWIKDENTASDDTDWTNPAAQGVHPGTTVAKTPSIVNKSFTTPAYVFAKVVVPCYASTTSGTIDTELYSHTPNAGWVLINTPSIDAASKTKTYIYAYGTSSAMTPLPASTPEDTTEGTPAVMSTTTTPVFSSVTVNTNLTAEQAEGITNANVVVTAYGIQTDGLGDPAPAPTAIYTLIPGNTL